MAAEPVISVVVPAYNEERVIATCLQHLQAQSIQQSYEIIVANNNSTDRTAAVAEKMGAHVLTATEKGYVHAAIAGVQAAHGEIIAMTDADTRVPPDWLQRIYATLQARPELVAVGGPFEFHDGPNGVRKMIKLLNRISPRLMIASLSGMNMAFRKSAYQAVGGFNPKINLQADTYLGNRLAKYGPTILIRDNVVQASGRRYQTVGLLVSETIVRLVNSISLKLFNTTLFKNQADIR
ncbi:MAG TPA: glycosyltransferase family 2 protein [Anaerolineales bacterium]